MVPGPGDEDLTLSLVVTDLDTTYVARLHHGALTHRVTEDPDPGGTTFTLTRAVLVALVVGAVSLPDALAQGAVTVDGDPAVLGRLVALMAPVDPDFAIVTP